MILMWPLLTLEKQWRLCTTLSREHRAVSAQLKLKPWVLEKTCLKAMFFSQLILKTQRKPHLASVTDRTGFTRSTAVLTATGCQPWHQQKTDMLLLFVLHGRHATSAMFPFSAPCLMRFYRCHRWTLASGRAHVGFSAAPRKRSFVDILIILSI